jgi:hypothetical protein
MMNKTIVTCITGGVDTLVEDHHPQKATFIAFLDSKVKSDLWKMRGAPDKYDDPNRNAKIIKWLIHKHINTKYSLWIDGNIHLLIGMGALIKRYLRDADIAMFWHNARSSVYDEAEICIKLGCDRKDVIEKQVARYREEGFISNSLTEGPVILRRHTSEVARFCELVFREVEKGSRRDQLAIDYIIWKTGIKVARFEGTIFKNKYFRKGAHKKRVNIDGKPY